MDELKVVFVFVIVVLFIYLFRNPKG